MPKLLKALHQGVNQREALQLAARLGCTITKPNRTGEVRISHPVLLPTTVVQDCRIKSATRKVVGFINRVVQLMQAEGAAAEPTAGLTGLRSFPHAD